MNQIQERLVNYRVYCDGFKEAGTVDVTLPDIAYKTDTVEGAGIAGSLTTPILGMFEDMTLTLNWRTIERAAFKAFTPGIHTLELRGSQQVTDVSTGQTSTVAVKISCAVSPTTFGLGTFAVGAATGSSSTFTVYQIKIWHGGVPVLEIDKPNFICVIDGVDYLAKVKADLGE